MIKYLLEGVPVCYQGPQYQRIYPNWDSTDKFREDVKKTLESDVSKGRKSGPFLYPPTYNFVGSPMGASRKRQSVKVRVIHDLSWAPHSGVNRFIDPEHCSVHYMLVDDAVSDINKLGRGALYAKIDLADAYKTIVVRPCDWNLLGSSWIDDAGRTVYYIDHVLPFGLKSSARLFNLFAYGLECFMKQDGCTYVRHYLDDYITYGSPDSSECDDNLKIMLDMCKETGMAVNPAKVVGPASQIEFLGIIIDTIAMETRISDERMDVILEELANLEDKRHCSKRQLLSILGKLVFVTRIIRPGRVFLRRLFDVSKKVHNLNSLVRITKEACQDISWWLRVARSWNHKCAFYEDRWTHSVDISLFTDASNWGFSGTFGTKWYIERFSDKEKLIPIAWRELLAIVWACVLWGSAFTSKRVLMYCDNQAIVCSVNNGSCKCPRIMELIRLLYSVCVHYSFECRLKYIHTLANDKADALSRGDVAKFKCLCPEASEFPSDLSYSC